MSRDALVIPQNSSLRYAAHQLAQAQVSGAPVVDEAGRCVGVISTTDFMRWVDTEERTDAERPRNHACICSDWQVFNADALPADEVATYVTADPVTASPSTEIDVLARMMLDAHIHRLVVLDADRRPTGIVTTTDILAAVAQYGRP